MSLRVMINHLEAVACRVRNEHAPGLRIEGAVIESAVRCMRDWDDADLSQHRVARGRLRQFVGMI
jgi:hypothetical protein